MYFNGKIFVNEVKKIWKVSKFWKLLCFMYDEKLLQISFKELGNDQNIYKNLLMDIWIQNNKISNQTEPKY